MTKIAILASDAPEAQEAAEALRARYGDVPLGEADVIVALGGDGVMLQALHATMSTGKPIYGMNRGSVGFLMNEYRPDGLMERLAAAKVETIHPLLATVIKRRRARFARTPSTKCRCCANPTRRRSCRISVDGQVRLEELICDGAAACDAGRLDRLQSLRPRPDPADRRAAPGADPDQRFPPAALARRAAAEPRQGGDRRCSKPRKRPVNAVADHVEFKSVTEVAIEEDRSVASLIMFDRDHSWDERILAEQFRY